MTRTGAALGTTAYMAPEQFERAKAVDFRCDIWAVGVVLFQMFCVRLPFEGESEEELTYSILSNTPLRVRDVDGSLPEELQVIIDKCLARKPVDRYQNLLELLADLNRIEQGRPVSRLKTKPRRLDLNKRVLTTLIAGAILSIAGYFLIRSFNGTAEAEPDKSFNRITDLSRDTPSKQPVS